MVSSTINILVTDSTSYKSSVISQFIKKRYKSVKIYMMSSTRHSEYFHTKYCDEHFFILNTNPKHYLKEIRTLVKNLSIDYIIPVNSKEMEFFLENKDYLSPCLDYLGELESFRSLNDKNNFYRLCQSLKLPIPKTVVKQDINSVFNSKKFVFKPTKGSGSQGIKYFESKTELISYARTFNSDFIVQEYVSGIGGGLSVFSQEGQIIEIYGHSRVAEYPPEGGSSSIRTKLPSRIFKLALVYIKKILERTQWSGFCMFEIKYNSDEIFLIEANPRIWGSIGQGLYDGTNYFSYILGPTENKSVSRYSYNLPMYMLSIFLGLIRGYLPKDKRILHCLSNGRPDIDFLDDYRAYIGQFLKKL